MSKFREQVIKNIETYRKHKKHGNEKMLITVNNLDDWFRDPFIFNISIDRVTMMGNFISHPAIKNFGEKEFQRLIDSQVEYFGKNKFHEEDGRFDELSIDFLDDVSEREPIGMLFNKVFFQIFDKTKFKKRRQVRLEFNPNKLTDLEKQFLYKKILPLLRNVDFTRIDVAFDLNEDVGHFYYLEPDGKQARKETVFYSASKAVETRYIGTRSSDNMIRIYNKKKEIEKRMRKGEDVSEQEIQHYQNHNEWFRIEFELKREMANDWHEEETIFRGLQILAPDWKTIRDKKDGWMIRGLMENQIDWKDLTRTEKTKYKQLIETCSHMDLMDELKHEFQKEKTRLFEEITGYIESTERLRIEKEFWEKKKANLFGETN